MTLTCAAIRWHTCDLSCPRSNGPSCVTNKAQGPSFYVHCPYITHSPEIWQSEICITVQKTTSSVNSGTTSYFLITVQWLTWQTLPRVFPCPGFYCAAGCNWHRLILLLKHNTTSEPSGCGDADTVLARRMTAAVAARIRPKTSLYASDTARQQLVES